MTFNHQQFVEDVYMYRMKRGLSRRHAADLIGINPYKMQIVEEGKYMVKADVLFLICDWMKKDLNYYRL